MWPSRSKGLLSRYNNSVSLQQGVKDPYLSFYSSTNLTSTILNLAGLNMQESLNTVTVTVVNQALINSYT